MMHSPTLLLVEDEESLRTMVRLMLQRDGWEVTAAACGEEALVRLNDAPEGYDLVLTDLKMRKISGLDVLREVKKHSSTTQVVMMTAFASADTAVEAMKEGAYDYIEKPFKKNTLIALLQKALEKRELLEENKFLKQTAAHRTSFGEMVGRSTAIQAVYDLILRVAKAKTNVLITGESGTGKELVARALHQRSSRANAPFVPINCGAIPESLIEGELFGHVKGAFTGAHRDKVGLFEAANGGTLFLDEVGELPKQTQVKLLRALQERRIQPIGATRSVQVDIRLVSATNRDLIQEIRDRSFREDLFYRLNVIHIQVPPLRERPEDIPLLAQHFLHRFSTEQGKKITSFSEKAMKELLSHTFPGNIRELENIVERAVTLEETPEISTNVLPFSILGEPPSSDFPTLPEVGLDLDKEIERLERGLLQQAIERSKGSRTEAAKLLGISFRSLRYRLDKYNID